MLFNVTYALWAAGRPPGYNSGRIHTPGGHNDGQ